MDTTREPAVAGVFFPAGTQACREAVRTLLGAASNSAPLAARPKALIVPHAGYVYSGAPAAAAYRLLEGASDIRRVVLLGPNHRVALDGIALPGCESFRTPMGEIAIDAELRSRISGLPGVVIDDRPHREEHALEVQLPFLQSVLGYFALLPMVVGRCSPERVRAVLGALWGEADALFVISTDLSHFHDYDTARAHDASTAERIEALQADLRPEDACGAYPLNGFLAFARDRGLALTRLALCNSGDSAGGRDRVVGYGAWRAD